MFTPQANKSFCDNKLKLNQKPLIKTNFKDYYIFSSHEKIKTFRYIFKKKTTDKTKQMISTNDIH